MPYRTIRVRTARKKLGSPASKNPRRSRGWWRQSIVARRRLQDYGLKMLVLVAGSKSAAVRPELSFRLA